VQYCVRVLHWKTNTTWESHKIGVVAYNGIILGVWQLEMGGGFFIVLRMLPLKSTAQSFPTPLTSREVALFDGEGGLKGLVLPYI
jgi:hypothetical protein